MIRLNAAIVPLRALLIVLFLGLLVGQVFSLPGMFGNLAEQSPELGPVPWLLLALGILEFVCVQVVIVCIWRLLTLVRADRIFSREAFVWVDAILGALILGWVLLAAASLALAIFIFVTPALRDPGIPIFLGGLVVVGGVVVLVVVVMRALLRQAALLQADMEEVI